MSRRGKALPKTPVEAKVDSLSHDGRGVAHVDGKAVFIEGALPGELVTFIYTGKHRKYDEAKVDSIQLASADRVAADCPHYERCGGCSLQHLSTQGQLQSKQRVLLENLERIGHVSPKAVIEALQGDVWSYRTKARLGVRYVAKKGKVLVGFREKRNSFITDSDSCEVLHARVGRIIDRLSLLIGDLSIKDQIPQIEVAVGDAVCCLIFRVLEPPSEIDSEKLARFGEEQDMQILIQPNKPQAIYSLWSNGEVLSYKVDDDSVEIYFLPQDFTQVNPSVNRKMIAQALSFFSLDKSDRVLDLFCGLGNFSLPIARRVARIIGVEGDDDMVARAKKNARHNGLDNVEFYSANLFEDQSLAPWLKNDFNKVLIDPPRSGAQEIIPLIASKAPEMILYVSCNPGTLARDAGILVNDYDYSLDFAGIIDMFPHTAHVESMAVFTKQ